MKEESERLTHLASPRSRWWHFGALGIATPLVALAAGCSDVASLSDHGQVPQSEVRHVVDGDAATGRKLITDTGCGVCHTIPGIPGAHGIVGPPLAGFGERTLIAGVVSNRPAELVTWVRDAPSLAPQTGMPSLPLSPDQANHVAAYLYSLR
jgi:mono/diheme cytochrome c family protein